MKHLLLKVFLLFISMLVIIGCSNTNNESKSEEGTDSSNDDVVEIDVLHIYSGKTGEAFNEVLDRYHDSQDKVKINPIFVKGSYDGVVEKLQSLAATDNLPNVVTSGFTYTSYMLENMPVVPVDKFIEEENYDLNDYFPKMIDLARSDDGTIHGLPFAVSTPVVYYNKDIFEEAGLNPEEALKSFDSVREAAQNIATEEVDGVYYQYGITGNWLLQGMIESAGGQMIADDGKSVGFDDQVGIDALQYWTDLVNTDKTMPNIDKEQSVQSFITGNLGVLVSTPAILTNLQSQSDFNVGMAPFPSDEKGSRKVPAGGNNLFIFEGTDEEQKASWDFLKFATSPEATAIIAEGMGYMAVRQSAVEDENLLGNYYNENPESYVPYEQVGDMVPWHNFPGKGGTQIYKILQDNVEAALNQQKTPEEAMKDAAEEANNLLK